MKKAALGLRLIYSQQVLRQFHASPSLSTIHIMYWIPIVAYSYTEMGRTTEGRPTTTKARRKRRQETGDWGRGRERGEGGETRIEWVKAREKGD